MGRLVFSWQAIRVGFRVYKGMDYEPSTCGIDLFDIEKYTNTICS